MQIAPLQHHKRPRNSAIDAIGNADGIHSSAIDPGGQGITVADVGAGLGAPGWGDHKCQQQHQVKDDTHGPVLVYDGGCPFCSHFAELSELRGGIAGLIIRDGRADHALRQSLAQRGCHLRDGAVVIDGDQLLHGSEAIHWMSQRLQPSAPLLQLLIPLFGQNQRAGALYPFLLVARRAALALRGLPVDPDSR